MFSVPDLGDLVSPVRCSRQARDPEHRTITAPTRKTQHIRRHTALTREVLPGVTRTSGIRHCGAIWIIAALLQRFSNPVLSCSNSIPEITEEVHRDFWTSLSHLRSKTHSPHSCAHNQKRIEPDKMSFSISAISESHERHAGTYDRADIWEFYPCHISHSITGV